MIHRGRVPSQARPAPVPYPQGLLHEKGLQP